MPQHNIPDHLNILLFIFNYPLQTLFLTHCDGPWLIS